MLARTAPLIFVCLWATGFIGARLGMPWSEPGTFLALRFALALALLTAIAMVAGAAWPGPKTALKSVLIGALIHGIYLGAVFWSIDHGMPAGVAAVVVGLQPLLTALIAGTLLKEPITTRHWLGLALGMTGVWLVLSPKFDLADSGITAITVTVSLVGMASVSIGTVLQKVWAAKTDLRTGTALQYIGAFIPVFLLALTGETGEIVWNSQMIVAMVWSIFILSFIAIFLLMWLIREGSVSKVASLFFLVPAVASLMAWGLFDEKLAPLQIAGMVLCAVAVALAARGEAGNGGRNGSKTKTS